MLSIPSGTAPLVHQPVLKFDGRLDEEPWRTALALRSFVHPNTGRSVRGLAADVKVFSSCTHLYVGVRVKDWFLVSRFKEHDDFLWQEDAVELMLDVDGDDRRYVEIQISPNGIVFDTWFDSRRKPAPVGHIEWNSGLLSAVQLHGKVNDSFSDSGYTVEMALAYAQLPAAEGVFIPQKNYGMRLNLYIIDKRQQQNTTALAWSPSLIGDFHNLERFGTIRFHDSCQ